MKLSMQKFVVFISIYLFSLLAHSSSVIGREIVVSGGSSATSYVMPIVLQPHGRNKLILGYIYRHEWRGVDTGIIYGEKGGDDSFMINELPSTANIQYMMIDCVKKTYAHYPYDAESNTGIKFFLNGDSHKWGVYNSSKKSDEHLFMAPWGEEEVTKMFEDACSMPL